MNEYVYLVLVPTKGTYEVHSVHATEAKAMEWMKCLGYGGDDVAMARMLRDQWGETPQQ